MCYLKDALFSPVKALSGEAPKRPVADYRREERSGRARKPLKDREATQRAAAIGERNSPVELSTERCLGGPSRPFHGEGNSQHPSFASGEAERMLDLPVVADGGTMGKSNAEPESPCLAAKWAY